MSSRARLFIVALFTLGLGAIDSALAQTATPAAVPTPSCSKPGEPPRLLSTDAGRSEADRKRNDWAKKMKDYVECLKRFIDEEQAAAAAHAKALNAAVDEYNNAIKAYNEQMQPR